MRSCLNCKLQAIDEYAIAESPRNSACTAILLTQLCALLCSYYSLLLLLNFPVTVNNRKVAFPSYKPLNINNNSAAVTLLSRVSPCYSA